MNRRYWMNKLSQVWGFIRYWAWVVGPPIWAGLKMVWTFLSRREVFPRWFVLVILGAMVWLGWLVADIRERQAELDEKYEEIEQTMDDMVFGKDPKLRECYDKARRREL